MIEEYIKELLPSDIPCVIGDLPSNASNIAAMWLYDSGVSTEYFSSGTLDYPVLKIVVRHENYNEANEWIETVQKTLNRYHDDVLLGVLKAGHFTYLGRGESKLHEFQLVLNIMIRSDE